MALNLYVARRKDGDAEYWAFVLEGDGKHYHSAKRMPLQENPKMAYIDAYSWALDKALGIITYEKLKPTEMTYHLATDTLHNWLNYHFEDFSKHPHAPQPYRKPVADLFNKMERIECCYRLLTVSTNRANAFAKEAYCEKQKGSKMVDIMSEFD